LDAAPIILALLQQQQQGKGKKVKPVWIELRQEMGFWDAVASTGQYAKKSAPRSRQKNHTNTSSFITLSSFTTLIDN